MSRIPLTSDDRDLNKRVAQALGWRELQALRVQSKNSLLLEGISPFDAVHPIPGCRPKQYVPNYSGDMNAALELIDDLRRRGYHGVSLSHFQRTERNGEVLGRWECFLENPHGRRIAESAETPQKAVCLALLNVLEKPPSRGVRLPGKN